MIEDLRARLESVIWSDKLERSGLLGRVLVPVLRYAYASVRDVVQGQLTLRAMGLVYTTLLSIVPLLAFSFALLKGFGLFETYSVYLSEFLAPFGPAGEELTDRVLALVDNVQGPVLLGVGLIIFLYTAISMVQKVEASFNYVWYVAEPRSFARRFSDYLVVLMFAPIIMLTALTLITSLQSVTLVQRLQNTDMLGPLFVLAGKTLPFILISGVFTFLYVFMPNTRVKVVSAMVGGVTGGALWSIMSAVFASFIVNSTRTQAIYAAFAIGIITLIWLYLNWLILLIGAQVAHYHQHKAYLRVGRREPALSGMVRERVAMSIMAMVTEAFRDSELSMTIERISERLHLPGIAIDPVVTDLIDGGLLLSTETETLVPGRDPSRILLEEILAVARGAGSTGATDAPSWGADIARLGERLETALSECVAGTTLADFVDAGTDA